ncbi:MAG: hypothetical protein AAFX94_10515, partial [Myxococcota bacterium]
RDAVATLEEFRVEGVRGNTDILSDRFRDYVASVSPVKSVTRGPAGGDGYRIRARLDVDRSDYSTFVLDLLTAYPFAGPLSPRWGDLDGTLHVEVLDSSRRTIATFDYEATVSYSKFFYSWWHTRFVEDAYKTLYAVSFSAFGEALRDRWDAVESWRPGDSVIVLERDSTETTDRVLAEWDRSRLRFITDAPRVRPGSATEAFFRALGGIEVGGFGGLARIRSGVTDESGAETIVASGDAMSRGYRVGIYAPPRESGLNLYPTFGFLSQRIEIEDFRESVDQDTGEPNATDIGAVCSNVDTGDPVDCDIPNVYDLDLQSLYLGARVSADLVTSNGWLRSAFSLYAGVNALEYRGIDVRVGQFELADRGFRAFRSYAFGGGVTLFVEKLHWGIRGTIDYETYLRFDYPQGLQFKGPGELDPDLNRFIRPRLTVDDAQLSTVNFQLTTFVAF